MHSQKKKLSRIPPSYAKQKDNNLCPQHLIRRKTLSKSFFISIKVRVWSRKRSFICCSRTLDRPLKLMSISLVFSKRSSLDSELHKGFKLQPFHGKLHENMRIWKELTCVSGPGWLRLRPPSWPCSASCCRRFQRRSDPCCSFKTSRRVCFR